MIQEEIDAIKDNLPDDLEVTQIIEGLDVLLELSIDGMDTDDEELNELHTTDALVLKSAIRFINDKMRSGK
jgi:hypothetical protein